MINEIENMKDKFISESKFKSLKDSDFIRPVQGYDGDYYVSRAGEVISTNYSRRGRIAYMSLSERNGYKQLLLSKNGISKMNKVHRLVASAFHPNPNKLPVINHKNEIKTDNRADNLEWCTYRYNSNYGTAIERRMEALMEYRTPVIQKDLKGNIIAIHWSIAYVADDEISKQGITNCCRGRMKYYKGFTWEYCNIEVEKGLIKCSLDSTTV